jgi:L-threonylcarbamoyladenylate synthase
MKRIGQEIKVNILRLDEHNSHEIIERTEKILREGGVAIVPTDTVYGIVCDGLNEQAKERIFEIKGRPADKSLIGFVNTIEKAKEFTEIPPEKITFLKEKWPGKTTFIIKAKRDVSHITSETGTMAFRIPNHSFLLRLVKKFDVLASTSANISGENAPCCVEEIPDKLKEKVDIVIDGGITQGTPSSIIDLTGTTPVQLR